jgi:hypothetical protein
MTRLIDHQGSARQALFDLIDWVEEDRAPPASTAFTMTAHNRLDLAPGAERGGIQPLVALTANGNAGCVYVRTGEKIRFEAQVAVPAQAGYLIAARWDFDGRGLWPQQEAPADKPRIATFVAEHVFDNPGIYFPALSVSAQRKERAHGEHFLTYNLGRIRAVVS